MTNDLCQFTALELGPKLERREVSPVEVIRAVQHRLDETEPFLNAYISRLDEQALAEARPAEGRSRRGNYRGPLHGVPIAIKDNIAVAGTDRDRRLEGARRQPAPTDAEVVRRLRAAGAIVVGKTNMSEMAARWPLAQPALRQRPQPLGTGPRRQRIERRLGDQRGRAPGAAGAGHRLPAARFGCRPPDRRRRPEADPRSGQRARLLASRTSPATTSGRSVARWRDVALILETMAGYDPLDPTCADRPVPAYRDTLRTDLKGVRLASPPTSTSTCSIPRSRRAPAPRSRCSESSAPRPAGTIPDLEEMMAARIALSAEGLALHDPYLRAHSDLYSDELRRRLLANYFIPARDLARANRVRRLILERFARVFQDVDLLATPTSVSPSVPLGAETFTLRDNRTGVTAEHPILAVVARLTSPTNQTGLPSISVPGGLTAAGLPIGFQLVARSFDEELLLGAAHAYEQATRWWKLPPPHVRMPAAASGSSG